MRKLVILALVMLVSGAVIASVPLMINYQGKLLEPSGQPKPDGQYQMTFAIYDVPTGGTALWSETNGSVLVKGGLFSVLLGSVVNLPVNIFDPQPDKPLQRFFGVKVAPAGEDLSKVQEMTPRQQIASAPFAFRAASVATVDDGAITTAKLADGAVTADKIPDGTLTAAKLGEALYAHRSGPEASLVLHPGGNVFGDMQLTLPGPGKVLILAEVAFKPTQAGWLSIQPFAYQGSTQLTSVATYCGPRIDGISSGSYHGIMSLPAGGSWTFKLDVVSNQYETQVLSYEFTAIYLGR